MYPVMSNSTCVSSGHNIQNYACLSSVLNNSVLTNEEPLKMKKKRNLPGNPDPDAEVIALSPRTLLTTNRYVCEVCKKGFQRDQNLQLHRRGHNLPWKLKQRNSKEINRKKAYVCPEVTCVHHHPSRALGDLTGIKKHFSRKHGEKKWKCEKCSKIYAVQSDWKAHSKTCGTREYKCDCGTLFSRKDSFITHRAFCDALAQESARLSAANILPSQISPNNETLLPLASSQHNNNNSNNIPLIDFNVPFSSPIFYHIEQTKAATMDMMMSTGDPLLGIWHNGDNYMTTRDFLGLKDHHQQVPSSFSAGGGLDHSALLRHQQGFGFCSGTWGN